jgi:hypothetical protein
MPIDLQMSVKINLKIKPTSSTIKNNKKKKKKGLGMLNKGMS